jgi:hypothetical protein
MSGTIVSVAKAIQDIILDFSEAQMKRPGNPPFHMKELTDHVATKVTVAPDSPGRILRLLKRTGFLDYKVEDRAKSLYRFV